MDNLPGLLLIQAGLIFLNAFFAATEIAVISLNHTKLKKLQESGDRTAGRLLSMAEEPSGFLSTIQIGITLAGFLGSAFAAENFSEPLTHWMYDILGFRILPLAALNTLSVIFITLILSYFTLIFGELVPKRIAMQKPYEVARFSCRIVSAIAFLAKPVITFLAFSTNLVLRLLGMKAEAEEENLTEEELRMMIELGKEAFLAKPVITFLAFSTNLVLRLLGMKAEAEEENLTEEELRMMIELGKEKGAIDAEETEWIQNVFDFRDTSILAAMTREADIVSLDEDSSEEEIISVIRESGLSRLPVYTKDREDIRGILYTREYLLNLTAPQPKNLSQLLHTAYFVPESIHADDLFRDMQTKKVHMAIVIDEYGNLSGLITLEDLLEEIVGNIYDEFDPVMDPEIEKVGENLWRFPGDTPVEEAAEQIGIALPEKEEYDTIGGMVLSCLRTFPKDGTTVDAELYGLSLHAEKIANRRIESVLVKKLPAAEKETGAKEE